MATFLEAFSIAEEHYLANRLQVAEQVCRQILQIAPNHSDTIHLLGIISIRRGHHQFAVDCLQRALAANPDRADAQFNLGIAFRVQGKMNEAAVCFSRALQLKPDFAAAHNNLGDIFKAQEKLDDAAACYRRTLQLSPGEVSAHCNLGSIFEAQQKWNEAAACYRQALQLRPDLVALRCQLIHQLQQMCQWSDLKSHSECVVESVAQDIQGESVAPVLPFSFLALPVPTTAKQQLRCAQRWAQGEVEPRATRTPVELDRPAKNRSRISIGYLSADFRVHATAFLIAELFEKHDRDRFEVVGYSYGRDDGSEMRKRIAKICDKFVDIEGLPSIDAARRIAADGVDILVDLKGYTGYARTEILALRPAPIQVNYLGFPGTMGASFMDYILVDDFIVPPDQQPYFAEKLVHLPGCYQVNDSQREISPVTPSRAECGLPPEGFVFCSFNNNYKITSDIFDVWMRLLKAVPGSVLWLLECSPIAVGNLRREAAIKGIASERLVFAPRRPAAEHLARYRLADLFLDTFPVNAHTTASDALWAGCPLLTIAGTTFVSRVAGSLLRAIGLPELITTSLEEYEAITLQLARDPRMLGELRARLEFNRATSSLFDAGRFARNLETAYGTMFDIYNSAEKPRPFAVAGSEAARCVSVSVSESPRVAKQDFIKRAERSLPITKEQTQETSPIDIEQILRTAIGHHQAGQRTEAESLYRRILAQAPDHDRVHYLLGMFALQGNRYDDSAEHLRRASIIQPTNSVYQSSLGYVLMRQGKLDEAATYYRQALKLTPDSAETFNNLGILVKDQGKLDEAIACYRRALELKPGYVEAYNNLGISLHDQGNIEEAIACYGRALELKPEFVEAINNLGNALKAKGKADEASACYRRALELNPSYADAHNNFGTLLHDQGTPEQAVSCFRQAIELNPRYAEAYSNLGTSLHEQGHFNEAIACFRQALELKPKYAEALKNLGDALKDEGKIDEAVSFYRRAVELKPNYAGALCDMVHQLQQICKWDGLKELSKRVVEAVEVEVEGENAATVSPFSFLALPTITTAKQQLRCAQRWADEHLKRSGASHVSIDPAVKRTSKITVGYLSADFRVHPMAFLMCELFEKHNRDRFEIVGYSYGPDDGSTIRQRLVNAFDRFVDIKSDSHLQAAKRIAADGVDILVDLQAYTAHARPAILAFHPAPIQVNYLGYPGTMGATFMDYILVDDFIVPSSQQPFYTEKLVHLPGCYQVNDSRREIADKTPSRAECGLPARGFVFCSFNNNYKITPDIFDVWMRILHAVPGSVLWLLEGNRYAPSNLHREAKSRGIAPERLVFAPRTTAPEHLARHRLADLFLDTIPYNAHVTASDALWAGCPLLTIAGETFPSRVAASLLRVLQFDELITTNLKDYESQAVRLANDPNLLREYRSRLAVNRKSAEVFHAEPFARKLEKAYTTMWEIHAARETPRSFDVPQS